MKEIESEINLWGKVIKLAITDIIYHELTEETTPHKLKPIDKENYISAVNFLYDDEYYFPFDDYYVVFQCEKCNMINSILLSELVKTKDYCKNCLAHIDSENTNYEIDQIQKEINLKELCSIMGMEDINFLRKSFKLEIEDKINKGLKIAKVN